MAEGSWCLAFSILCSAQQRYFFDISTFISSFESFVECVVLVALLSYWALGVWLAPEGERSCILSLRWSTAVRSNVVGIVLYFSFVMIHCNGSGFGRSSIIFVGETSLFSSVLFAHGLANYADAVAATAATSHRPTLLGVECPRCTSSVIWLRPPAMVDSKHGVRMGWRTCLVSLGIRYSTNCSLPG